MSDDINQSGTSRRGFLQRAVGGVLGAGVLGTAAASSASAAGTTTRGSVPEHVKGFGVAGRQQKQHRHYARGNFENAKGATMVLKLNGEPVTLSIVNVRPLHASSGARAGSDLWHNAFAVDLTGPKGVDIAQGTYPVSVAGRSFDLFVVPVIRTGEIPRYEAIINRAFHAKVRA